MTDHDFEQFVRIGMRRMVEEAASPSLRASVNAIPDAIPVTPHRPGMRWTFPRASRLAAVALAATALVVAVVIGIGLIFRSPHVGPSPAPGPTTSTAPASTTTIKPIDYASGWTATGSMNGPRLDQTATLLLDGKVLVAGGVDGDVVLASAELYDPLSRRWTVTGSMATPRSGHTATLLADGRVLVAGGAGTAAELYDPVSGLWWVTGNMTAAREQHTATLLQDGRVLVAGGEYNGGPVASAELYDPVRGTWSATGSMGTPRHRHTATLLLNGMVLVAGGSDHGGGACCALASSELYDPVTGTWTATGSMVDPHANNAAALLTDGRVLVGGAVHELYDPASGTWTATGDNVTSCCRLLALADGRVLVLGTGIRGTNDFTRTNAAFYDPRTGSWTPAGTLGTQRYSYTATLLLDGLVLVAGGWSDPAPVGAAQSGLPSAELLGSTSER